MIEPAEIRRRLQSRTLGGKVYSFDVIDSTNSFAKSLSEEDSPHGTLVLAEEQTQGRGRQGRRWEAEKGMNLLFSVVFRTPFIHERARILPFVAALATADAVEQTTRCKVECKWPNDLLIDKKKFAGMLIEAEAQNDSVTTVILGTGVNVNQTGFSDDLVTKATSLRLAGGVNVDRVGLLCRILEELERRLVQLGRFSTDIVLDEWKRHTTMIGSTITLTEKSGRTTGKAVDVAPNGALLFEEKGGARREVFAGDVTLG
ncbi:MAG TPA: biotin--[acetyl-CoA-carboxylase] ligase [Bacteroidota bacterium]|nr:biotin--[acetyl-CoA-carboxylase] ligase [Bacteroidota bacterium]